MKPSPRRLTTVVACAGVVEAMPNDNGGALRVRDALGNLIIHAYTDFDSL